MPYRVAARRYSGWIFALCLSLAMGAAGASAQVISNIGSAKGIQSIEQTLWVAQPFITGTYSSGFTLTNVSLVLDVASLRANGGGDDGPTGGSLYVSIYSSSDSSVGSLLNDGLLLGSLDPGSGTNVWTPASSSTVQLAPSTEYWLVATTNATAMEYGWAVSSNQSSSGDIGWSVPGGFDYSNNQGATWYSTSNDVLFSINASEAAAPEPKTWACLLLAFAGGWLVKLVRAPRRQNLYL